mgnify:CR=1 FL=1
MVRSVISVNPSIYLGIQGYGCARAEEKDRFAHRFRQGERVCCYAVSDKGRYAIQNRLQEGKAYHLTIRQGTVTEAVLCPADAQGTVNAVSGSSVTINGCHLPCRAVFEIRTRAGGAVLLPCFLSSRIVGSYAQAFDGVVYIQPAPSKYEPPIHGVPGLHTLKNLLRTAMMPIGAALYVYGGGWNWQDTASGNTAMHIGLSQSWLDFFDRQNACYAYRSDDSPAHSWYPTGGWNQYGHNGLDCSGYLGWVLYNLLHTKNASVSDCDGYVVPAAEFAHSLAQRGWGTLCRQDRGDGTQEPSAFRPGDIFSMDGHVWLCVGPCRDGSIVIAHSTPSPSRTGCKGGGVQLSALDPHGDHADCQALRLAQAFMQRCPRWNERYQAQLLPYSVYGRLAENPHAGLFRWNTSFLPDPENLRSKTAENILQTENHAKSGE